MRHPGAALDSSAQLECSSVKAASSSAQVSDVALPSSAGLHIGKTSIFDGIEILHRRFEHDHHQENTDGHWLALVLYPFRAREGLSDDGLLDVGLRRDGAGGFAAVADLSSERSAPTGSSANPKLASVSCTSVDARLITGAVVTCDTVPDELTCDRKDKAA